MRRGLPGLLLTVALLCAACGAGHAAGPGTTGPEGTAPARPLAAKSRPGEVSTTTPAATTTTTGPPVVVIPPAGQPGRASRASPSGRPSPTSTTSPASAPKTLAVQFGSGDADSAQFTVTEPSWQLNWSYSCSSFGSVGNFIVTVNGYGSALDTQDEGPNQLGVSGSGSDQYGDQGVFNLSIESECTWTLSVVES